MFITSYCKLISCSCAIKTLNLKFLTESKVKKKLTGTLLKILEFNLQKETICENII